MRFNTQNLNDDHGNAPMPGSLFSHGRCWWNLTEQLECRAEWKCWDWSSSFGVSLDLADGEDAVIGWSVRCGLFALYMNIDHFTAHNWLSHLIKRPTERYGNGREIGISWFMGRLSVKLWADPMDWHSTDPKWWAFSIEPRTLVLGHPRYARSTYDTKCVEIPMPEAIYPARVDFEESVWTFPRWPWPTRRLGCTITPDTPIPCPGKGENSWDCGEDAIHSLSCSATTTHDAVGEIVKSVMRDRHRYGGLAWRPQGERGVVKPREETR